MDVILASFLVRYNKWESIDEMKAYLINKCLLGHLLINDIEHSRDDGYSLTVNSKEGFFGIGLITYNNGIAPSIIFNTKEILIVLGHGRNICIIDVDKQNMISQISIRYELFQFHTLNHLGIGDFFIIQSELEIIAVTFKGIAIWKYEADDIIEEVSITDHILIKSFDLPTKKLQIINGFPL